MADNQSWSGPGLILNFFKISDPSKISEETLVRWFDEEYVPAQIANGSTKAAWLCKAVNPNYDKQHVVLYKISDLSVVKAGAMNAVPRTSSQGLFEGEADDAVEYDSRIYSFVQHYVTEKQEGERKPTMMIAMMQPPPGGEADLDAWYRKEHNQQMSEQPGWKHTSRFQLVYQHNNTGKEIPELSFLAIHEFGEDNKLGKEVKPLEPVSDWTKKILGETKEVDAAIYKRVKVLGEGKGK